MLPISKDELARWRAEIALGVEHRDKQFGTYRQQQAGSPPSATLAGKNIELFEQGGRSDKGEHAPNIIHAIVRNVVPTRFFQTPRVLARPDGQAEPDDAAYVAELLNKDLRSPTLRIKETCKLVNFDGYLLASGVVKTGYATEFGQDILRTEAEERTKKKNQLKAAVQQMVRTVLGQPPKEEVEPVKVNIEESIKSESPYIKYISPFDFVIDWRARDITEATWVAQLIRRTLSSVKADRRYGSAKHDLVAEALDDDRIPDSEIEEFQGVDVWEVHYKNLDSPTGISILTFAAIQEQTRPLMHEHNICDIEGWQYEWLNENKHGHALYPVSTISIIRPLVEIMQSSFEAIMEQVEKFVAKVAYNERVTPDGETALDDPTIGNRVKISGSEPIGDCIKVIEMQRVAGDVLGLINQVIDFIILITGLTRAQLTGLTTAQTATEAQIGQSGQNLRRTDEANTVSDWFKRVMTKYWKIKAQFQDLTEIPLLKPETMLNAATGMPETQWYPPIDAARAERLRRTRFDFDLEPFSMQKPNLEIIRAQFAEFMRGLMEPIVTQGLAVEGKRVSASEALRQWAKFFEEAGLVGLEKMIVPIGPQDPVDQQALLNYGQTPTGPEATGNGLQGPQNRADLISAAAGPRGQGMSPA